MHGVRLGHARGVPRRPEWRGSRGGALTDVPYILTLDDGSPEARACERIGLRLAEGLSVSWAPIPVVPQDEHGRPARRGTIAEHDWVVSVVMPWSGDAVRLRQLTRALPHPLLAVSPAAARRIVNRVSVSQRVVLHVADPDSAASARVAAVAAGALSDWRSEMGPRAFARGPERTGSDVELIVTPSATLEDRRTRRAFEHSRAPVLVVPDDGDRAWPDGDHTWAPPLTLLH